MTDHTPTPWLSDWSDKVRILDLEGRTLFTAETDDNEAGYNSDFLVNAVNSYDEMLAELRQAYTELTEAAALLSGSGMKGMGSIYALAAKRVQLSIAKAEAR